MNSSIVWLTTTKTDRNLFAQLRSIINTTRIFNEVNECIDYLTKLKTDKIFMIIDYTFESELVLIIHELSQVDSIYLYKNREGQDHLCTVAARKIKGIFIDIKFIFNLIKANIQRWNDSELSISSITSTDISSNDLNQLDSSFMYSQLIKETLLDIKYSDMAKTELVEYCRHHQSCGGTQNVSSVIDEFEQDYDKYSPVWWYTRDCFTYFMLNQALRDQDVKTLITMGFFLRDVHQRIEYLHKIKSVNRLTVYRGQGMSEVEFKKKILENPGGLLSFNSFLSTSLDITISKIFAESVRENQTLVGILFQMDIDATISSAPFAELEGNDSYFGSEAEILFSMHTIFRIEEVKKIEDRLWHVKLKLTSNQDKDLVLLSKQIRSEIKGGTAWYRLSHLLAKMGKFREATDVLIELLNTIPKNNWKYLASINHQLGVINREKGNYNVALTFYNTALKYEYCNFAIDRQSLGITYNDIGEVHRERGNNLQALAYYQKTLDNFEESSMSTSSWYFAILYNNIGQTFRSMGDYSTALGFFRKALSIHRITFRPNDPLLGTLYNNIGAVYTDKGEHSQALLFYNTALDIEQRSLPSDHPSLAVTHNNIGKTYLEMKDYSNAVSEFEKSISIAEKSICPDHPSIAVTYCNMSHAYGLMNGDYWLMLTLCEKARHILETNSASNNPALAMVYFYIGEAYCMKGDYYSALFALEKTLEIQKRNLLPNHLHMSHTYISLAVVFYKLNDYQQALTNSKLAIKIASQDKTPAGVKTLNEILGIFTHMNEEMSFR